MFFIENKIANGSDKSVFKTIYLLVTLTLTSYLLIKLVEKIFLFCSKCPLSCAV